MKQLDPRWLYTAFILTLAVVTAAAWTILILAGGQRIFGK